MSISIRASNMLKASILADAGTMPLHWIYNQAELASKVGTNNAFFFEVPSCPFYSYPSGTLSPYGAEALPFFQSVADLGEFNFNNAAQSYYSAMKKYSDESINGYTGRLNHVPKQFIENRDQRGLDWADCHVDDSQAQGISKVALIVARYAGHPDLIKYVTQMVDTLQISPISIESSVLLAKLFERILFKQEAPASAIASLLQDADKVNLTLWQRHILRFILSDELIKEVVNLASALAEIPLTPEDNYRNGRIMGKVLNCYFSLAHPETSLSEAMNRASGELSASDAETLTAAAGQMSQHSSTLSGSDAHQNLLLVGRSLGLSCVLPSALLVSLYIVRESTSLVDAVTKNVLMGGDNCSRAMVVAAAFAAFEYPLGDVLQDWESRVQSSWWSSVSENVEKIVRENRAFDR